MKSPTIKIQNLAIAFSVICFHTAAIFAQQAIPVPGVAKPITVPAISEKTLPNGLTVAVVERKNVPLVTAQLLIKSGANIENANQAGLANVTFSLLTKGTKTRTATQIAEQMEYLGGSISTGAEWNKSNVSITVMADKLGPALAIMSDVVLNPVFKQQELTLLKSQMLDNLTYSLKQPGFLGNYVASAYSFGEHPAGGTPSSLNKIAQKDIIEFHKNAITASNAVLIFTGDITPAAANQLAQQYFGKWKTGEDQALSMKSIYSTKSPTPLVKRMLVVDMPDSGQASVKYLQHLQNGRIDHTKNSSSAYYPAIVLNSALGGGYSSRLNQEIRIKRGLSYGAGSNFTWRKAESNFMTSTQTKNESAAEVAALILEEIKKLTQNPIEKAELNPRKLALTGDFGRNLETTDGLAAAVSELYSFGIPTNELNTYMKNVDAISDQQIRDFAKGNLLGGDIVIVGDYAKFKDDLKKRFPDLKVEIIKADSIDLSKLN
jgi:zinc protease